MKAVLMKLRILHQYVALASLLLLSINAVDGIRNGSRQQFGRGLVMNGTSADKEKPLTRRMAHIQAPPTSETFAPTPTQSPAYHPSKSTKSKSKSKDSKSKSKSTSQGIDGPSQKSGKKKNTKSNKKGNKGGSKSASDDVNDGENVLLVQVIGTAEQEFRNLDTNFFPNLNATETYSCFFGLRLYNLRDGQLLGGVNECFLEYQIQESDGFALFSVTEFQFRMWGTLLTKTEVTMQPVEVGNRGFNYITGAISDSNGIVGGTDEFSNTHGYVRRNGQLELSSSGEGVNATVTIKFDEIFVIDLYKFNYENYQL